MSTKIEQKTDSHSEILRIKELVNISGELLESLKTLHKIFFGVENDKSKTNSIFSLYLALHENLRNYNNLLTAMHSAASQIKECDKIENELSHLEQMCEITKKTFLKKTVVVPYNTTIEDLELFDLNKIIAYSKSSNNWRVLSDQEKSILFDNYYLDIPKQLITTRLQKESLENTLKELYVCERKLKPKIWYISDKIDERLQELDAAFDKTKKIMIVANNTEVQGGGVAEQLVYSTLAESYSELVDYLETLVNAIASLHAMDLSKATILDKVQVDNFKGRVEILNLQNIKNVYNAIKGKPKKVILIKASIYKNAFKP